MRSWSAGWSGSQPSVVSDTVSDIEIVNLLNELDDERIFVSR